MRACVRACVCACVLSDSSETVQVIIVKLSTVTASDNMVIHHVLLILTLTFIQGYTDRNHENNKGSIISETVQAVLITFAVKIVRLKVYMTVASPRTLIFTQGDNCVSILTYFKVVV